MSLIKLTKNLESFQWTDYSKAGTGKSPQPDGTDYFVYKDFDAYMTKLDPVAGYLSNKFGKDKADRLVNEFLFTYG